MLGCWAAPVPVSAYDGIEMAPLPVRWIAAAGLLSAVTPASAATLSKCTYAKLAAAAAKSGEVRFECGGAIKFTKPIQVTRNVTLDAAGRDVTLDGRGRNQLFV